VAATREAVPMTTRTNRGKATRTNIVNGIRPVKVIVKVVVDTARGVEVTAKAMEDMDKAMKDIAITVEVMAKAVGVTAEVAGVTAKVTTEAAEILAIVMAEVEADTVTAVAPVEGLVKTIQVMVSWYVEFFKRSIVMEIIFFQNQRCGRNILFLFTSSYINVLKYCELNVMVAFACYKLLCEPDFIFSKTDAV